MAGAAFSDRGKQGCGGFCGRNLDRDAAARKRFEHHRPRRAELFGCVRR